MRPLHSTPEDALASLGMRKIVHVGDAASARLAAGNIPVECAEFVARYVAVARAKGAIFVSDLAGTFPPPRRFLVDGMIPARTVTMLGGDGGTGKSLVALQLAAAKARGGFWLGREVSAGGALVLSAEDELDEVHRRLISIASGEGFEIRDLSRLSVWPLAGWKSSSGRDKRAG